MLCFKHTAESCPNSYDAHIRRQSPRRRLLQRHSVWAHCTVLFAIVLLPLHSSLPSFLLLLFLLLVVVVLLLPPPPRIGVVVVAAVIFVLAVKVVVLLAALVVARVVTHNISND